LDLKEKHMMAITSISASVTKWVIFSLLLPTSSGLTLGQQSKASEAVTPKNATERSESEDGLLKWRSILDTLRTEIQSIPEEYLKPYVIAQVADAYWNIDQEVARGLFIEALSQADSLGSKFADKNKIIYSIISLAGRRDAELAKSLTERHINNYVSENNADQKEFANYSRLLNSPHTVWEKGQTDHAAKLIFELAQHDSASADSLFTAYLNKAASNANFPLDILLNLCGYPFGYTESYGFRVGERNVIYAFQLPHISVSPNRPMALMFLDVSYERILATLNQAATLSAEDKDATAGLALLSICYLLPEVARYSPDAISRWQMLHQQALAVASTARQDLVKKQLQFINRSRPEQQRLSEDPQAVLRENKDSLDIIDKLPVGCNKDDAYVRYVLGLNLKQDYSAALDVTKKIQNTATRKSVQQILHFRKALSSIEAGDVSAAKEIISLQITVPELNALLCARIARSVASQSKQGKEPDAILQALRWSESIERDSNKAAVLLVALRITDGQVKEETAQVLRNIVAIINKLDRSNVDILEISYDIALACGGQKSKENDQEIGHTESVSLLDTITSLRSLNPDQLLTIVNDLSDPSTRIRSIASIVKGALKASSSSPLKKTDAQVKKQTR
jgi:hypothetical protein